MASQENKNERSQSTDQSTLERMVDGQQPRLIRDKFNQISDILDEKPTLDIVQYLEIKDLLNSNKKILKKEGKENLTQYQKEKIDAYKKLDEQLNIFSDFEDNIEPEVSDILSKKGSNRYWNKRIDAIQKYVSSEDANGDMIRYFSDYVGNAINSFTKKDGYLKARKDPDTYNKLKELKKDITRILYDQNNANKLNDSKDITTNTTETDTGSLDKEVKNYDESYALLAEGDLDELLASQTKMGILEGVCRILVNGATGHLNGPYNVSDIYSETTIELSKIMGEYDILQRFTVELNKHANNWKEAIAYIIETDEKTGFIYTPDIKKINLHSKYKIKNSERKEDKLFTVKQYFSPRTRFYFLSNGGSWDELATLARDFNSTYHRSSDDSRPEMDKRAELLAQIVLYNKAGDFGKVPKARLPRALM